MHKTGCRPKNYCCALNADGTLKDASEITFFNDPDDKVPLPQVASSAQPSSSTTSAKDTFSVLLKAGCTHYQAPPAPGPHPKEPEATSST
ncbi:uncharacterized protein F5147DRAFT_784785 [Suillus discolor]|uniref:Uncharacterized protein n=1 Tax=Suillus discolor TaxID=1912936 RepID=A0A9P7ER60_9AGAM|nr:uncharacterized protein F5147DRAFT_784785 [Suillus discolor]KAG2079758.1 hypothetical protein F5147DRAFT_784785 [Suillus discolor]